MNAEILTVLIILICTMILLITELVRIDVVAIVCMLALGWTGILEPEEMLSGFSSNAVIAMMAVMIIGYGITKTGIMDKYASFIIKKCGDRKKRTISLMSFSIGLVSGFILNIGAAALFLPGAIYISRRSRIPMSIMIMPLGFAAIIGGTLTMMGSGHLILVNDILKNSGHEVYNIYSVAPIGIVLLITCVLYFYFFGKYVLPPKVNNESKQTEQEKLIKELGLPENIWYYSISEESPLIGVTTEKSGIWEKFNINIIGISGDRDVIYAPWRETKFQAGQELALLGNSENIRSFAEFFKLIPEPSLKRFSRLNNPDESGFAEIIIRPRSEYIGQAFRKVSVRKRFAVEPVRLFSKGEEKRGDFSDHEIIPGDTIIVYGLWEKIREMQNYIDFVVATPIEAESKDHKKIFAAVLCLLLAVGLAIAKFSIPMAFLTGAVAMILSRVISIRQAYKAIDWKVVFLLAGLIPLGLAMQKTGTAHFIAENIMELVTGKHPLLIIAAIGIIATLFSLFMSNVGAIVVLAPLVISMGEIGGLDPRPLVLFAAICISNSFLLPTQQVNALYMSPGGYKTKDFLKAGSGITILFLIVVISMFYFLYF